MEQSYYIIDFDSTFTQVEALDELAKISLSNNTESEQIYLEIEALTNAAMDGKLSFTESLEKRVQLLHANQTHLQTLISFLKKKVSTSFSRNRIFFQKHAKDVLIVSGGFKEFITPVVSQYSILPENIYANTFLFDTEGNIIGYDKNNPLSQEGGKVKLLKGMNLQGDLYGIGDGYSDFQLKESGLIKKFYAFTENIARESITKRADHITPNFDEFLYINNLPRAISYPKNRILCLIIGDVPQESINFLQKDGFSIRHKETFEDKYTKDIGMLLLANNQQIDSEQLKKAEKLKVIGYLGNVKEHVDTEICTDMGIIVFDDSKENPRNGKFIPKRMADFMNQGHTNSSCNFPNIQLPRIKNAHRMIHIHQNVPGIMAKINHVLAKNNINILAQFLLTNPKIGYAITDIDTGYEKSVLKELKKIENTIKFRLLY